MRTCTIEQAKTLYDKLKDKMHLFSYGTCVFYFDGYNPMYKSYMKEQNIPTFENFITYLICSWNYDIILEDLC